MEELRQEREKDIEVGRAGEILKRVKDSEKYESLRDLIIKIAGTSEPNTKIIREAADFIIEQTAELMGTNRDDQLIYAVGDIDSSFDVVNENDGYYSQETDYAKIIYNLRSI